MRFGLGLVLCGTSLSFTGCGTDTATDPQPVHIEFPKITLQPGEENLSLCQSFTLNNEQELYINEVTMANDGGFHHSNWFWVPESYYDGPDGTWDCASRDYSQYVAALAGGTVFAQSTQASSETMGFAANAAYKIGKHARIVGGLHLLNPNSDPLDTGMTLDFQPIPKSDAEVILNPAVFAYHDLAIPGNNARSRFQATCDLQAAYGAPLDFSFYYMLPHYHSLGTGMGFVTGMPSGPYDVFDSSGMIGEAKSKKLDPPFDARLTDGKFTFSCDYYNPQNKTITWGDSAKDEMCIMVTFTDSPYTISSLVLMGSAQTSTVDGVQVFEAPCGPGFTLANN